MKVAPPGRSSGHMHAPGRSCDSRVGARWGAARSTVRISFLRSTTCGASRSKKLAWTAIVSLPHGMEAALLHAVKQSRPQTHKAFRLGSVCNEGALVESVDVPSRPQPWWTCRPRHRRTRMPLSFPITVDRPPIADIIPRDPSVRAPDVPTWTSGRA